MKANIGIEHLLFKSRFLAAYTALQKLCFFFILNNFLDLAHSFCLISTISKQI